MNDFLSKISGQIAGPIILAAFFPVVLFAAVLVLVVLPITPYMHPLTSMVAILKVWEDKTSAVIILTAVVLVLSVVLYMLNVPVIRLYEGYPWSQSWIGIKLAGAERKRINDVVQVRSLIKNLRKELRSHKVSIPEAGVIEAQRSLGRVANDEYPTGTNLVLPTRLGNVIRSFETYPMNQYGLPLIAIWPRLQAVIPSTYAQGLEGAQTSFSFMLNCSFLSGVLAVLLTICGLRWRHPWQAGVALTWTVWLVVLLASWRLFYYAAIGRAAEWGTQVRAAFDLYRGTLLTQLGYDLKPQTPAEERRIWGLINYKFAFPDDRSYAELPYKPQSTSLLVEPAETVVQFSRTVAFVLPDTLRVKITVVNADPDAYDATEVILRDDVLTGQTYITDSATVDGIQRQPTDLSPLRISLGKLAAGQQCILSYKLKVPATV